MARASSLKLRPQTELTIILEDLDFSWHQHEIDLAVELWNSGVGIADIAKQIRPTAYPLRTARDAEDEVALLIMHLCRQGKIRPRPGGIFGEGVVYGEKRITKPQLTQD